MDLQYFIVIFIIAAAAVFGALNLRKRIAGFSPKKGKCDVDCGCGKAEN